MIDLILSMLVALGALSVVAVVVTPIVIFLWWLVDKLADWLDL